MKSNKPWNGKEPVVIDGHFDNPERDCNGGDSMNHPVKKLYKTVTKGGKTYQVNKIGSWICPNCLGVDGCICALMPKELKPSPRPDGWEEQITTANWKTNPLYGKVADFVQGAMDDEYGDSNATSLAILEEVMVPFIRSLLLSQHHKDIEAFRGMIEGMIKKSPEVCHKGKHCDICSHISDHDQALTDVLTALSKMEEEK